MIVDGYSMSSFLSTASVHSGVLRDGETGSVYIKLSDVMDGNFSGTTKNGVTSRIPSPTSNFSFKIYSNTFVNGPEPEAEPRP